LKFNTKNRYIGLISIIKNFQIVSLCLDAYNKGSAGVKAACQATTSQTLVEYGKYLGQFSSMGFL
jgi:hypothetical protein